MDDEISKFFPDEEAYLRLTTTADRYEAWRRESRDRRFQEEVIRAWAQGVLKKLGLPTRFDPYVFSEDGKTYRVATQEEIEELAKSNKRPLDLSELVAVLNFSREANMAAQVLSAVFALRKYLDIVTPKINLDDRPYFEAIFNCVYEIGLIYSEMAMLREPEDSRKVREASRKVARQRADRSEWDKEFALAEELAAEGKSERQQAEIIAKRTGAKINAVRDRLRRQRGTARREPKRKN